MSKKHKLTIVASRDFIAVYKESGSLFYKYDQSCYSLFEHLESELAITIDEVKRVLESRGHTVIIRDSLD